MKRVEGINYGSKDKEDLFAAHWMGDSDFSIKKAQDDFKYGSQRAVPILGGGKGDVHVCREDKNMAGNVRMPSWVNHYKVRDVLE